MSNPGYARTTKRWYCNGIDLNSPVDSVREGYFPILENLRTYTSGVVQPRLGITAIADIINSKTPAHSVRRLNNKADNTWTRVVGVGDSVAYGQTSFTRLQYNGGNVAGSGNPLALLPWRPDQSPASWMYIADSLIMRKLTYNGTTETTHQVGIAPPTLPPTVELGVPVDLFTSAVYTEIFKATTNWTSDGTVAGAVTSQTRLSTTVVTALYDSGTTGWVSIVPTSATDIGPGMMLNIIIGLNQYDFQVYEIYRATSATASTIATVLYDNNPTNTGMCTIVPSNAFPELSRNCVVLINAVTYARVIELVRGPDTSVVGIRCDTGATTVAAAQSIKVVNSFRGYLPDTAVAGNALSSKSIRSTFTAASATVVTGSVTFTVPVAPWDLSAMGASSNKTGIADNEYFHVSFKCDDLSKLVQGRILFDCGDGTFTQNFFYRSFTPSDLILAAKGTQTAIAAQNVRNIRSEVSRRVGFRMLDSGLGRGHGGFNQDADNNLGSSSQLTDRTIFDQLDPISPNPGPRDQTGTGDSQWHEIRFRRGDCVRVGSQWNLGWAAINKFRLELTTTASASANVIEVNSFSVWGGYSPDIGDIGAPYLFRYRYRSSVTGAKSNWSPATRSGIISTRQYINISCTSTSLPDIDLIDVQRWGGTITSWADVGTIPKASSPFVDTVSDNAARATLPDSELDTNYQPWVVAQPPKTGTATTVAGTLIKDSGTNFDTAWVKGTTVKVKGLYTSIRKVWTTSLMEVEDAVASGSSLAWEITEPFKASQPLPCLWGPYNGWFFACGDSQNPGRLYYSNKNDPDTTQDTFYIEITSPSDPLQNGVMYNGHCYVFSSEKMYEIIEISPDGQFVYQETPAGKGMMFRWGICVGPYIWFLSKDGIYQTDGGQAISITDDTLYPLFPHEGQVGSTVNGFLAPNMISGQDANFRLSYYDDYLYFDYIDTAAARRTLVYSAGSDVKGWFPDVYTPGITYHYGEEGEGIHNLLLCGADNTTAKLYSYGGLTDNGTAVSWHAREPSFDAGDRRADKIYGDFILNANPGGGTINVAAGVNNYSTITTLNSTTMTGGSQAQKVFDILSGNGVEARNFAIDLSGTGTLPKIYITEPSHSPRPEDTYLRALIYDDCEYPGEKFFQGIEIETDTDNAVRTARIEYDGGTLGATLSIQHNGQIMKPYSFPSGFTAHMVRIIPTDGNFWKQFLAKWIWEPEPPLVSTWESQQTSHGHVGYIHLKCIWITHTSTADLTLTITRMDDNTSQTFTIPNSGGVRGRESYILLGPAYFCKGKTFKYKLTQADSVPFRVYLDNCGVMLKPWGSEQQFTRWAGWGAVHGDGKATI